MKIIVDAFGGDNCPLEVIKGCALAVEGLDIDIVLTGIESEIRKCAEENNISLNRMEIVHCDEVITMEDEPNSVLKSKKNSSMAVGIRLLNEGKGDAFISAGNSGALCVGATLGIKRIKGIKRPAFAPVIPTETGSAMLLDGGANVDCRPEMLYQFALMGSVYMERVMKVKNPRVGLGNVGVEDHKGTELYRETYKMLKDSSLNFIGNVEGRDISKGVCDVVVCDGFTGNVIIKMYEGTGTLLLSEMKNAFYSGIQSKLGALLVKNALKRALGKYDVSQYGGAPVLGLKSLVVKMHGSAKAKEVKRAIEQCVQFYQEDIAAKISSYLENS